MLKTVLPFFLLTSLFMLLASVAQSQVPSDKTDTFFLVKKKGLLGQLGKSISTSADETEVVKKKNPYIIYSGRTIRQIKIVRLGFEREINDTTKYNNKFSTIVANAFHKKTKAGIIANNLFFEAGDRVNPFLMADNERYLREQPYLQDALIVIEKIATQYDSVDVLVLVKDVFSLGGSVDIASEKKMQLEVKDENIWGSGSKLAVSMLYDYDRTPRVGFGTEFLKRNIGGSFINWTIGFKSYKSAFNSGRNEESILYTNFEKPLVSPYIPWVGGLYFSLNKTKNNYLTDTLYREDYQYSYHLFDAWFGYNFGSKKLSRKNQQTRIRKYVALRGLHQRFSLVPEKVEIDYDYHYANVAGILASAGVFKQDFYRTNFIYGFGRNEDVPEGFSASFVGGWIKRKDSINNNERSRPYYALEGSRSHLSKNGSYGTYTLQIGGYVYKSKLEDFDILLTMDNFTQKKRLGTNWYYRQFYNGSFTRQISTELNPPLYLNSVYGLPYFKNGGLEADMRFTAKTEAVFYNLKKFWGFRFAPFLFGDACVMKPVKQEFSQSELYGAVGAGVRTRNENLIFGTIELRTYYFPRTVEDMKNWRVEVSSNIRFKYSTITVRKPDFIIPN